MEIEWKVVRRNGVAVKIYDTVGLEADETQRETQLKNISNITADLIVFCVPVGPGSKLKGGILPAIMRSLHEAFSTRIWHRCVVAFTFSDYAREMCKSKLEYEQHIKAFAKGFQELLMEIGVKNVTVTTPFDQEEAENDQLKMIAIPVADKAEDQILPGIELKEGKSWIDYFFIEMVRCCGPERQNQLLKFRYSIRVQKILTAMGYGTVFFIGGAAVGAIAGALIRASISQAALENAVSENAALKKTIDALIYWG